MTDRKAAARDAITSLCALTALALSFMGLSGVLVAGPWMAQVVGVIAIVGVSSAVARLLGAGRFSPSIGSVAGGITVLVLASSLRPGLADPVTGVGSLIHDGVQSLANQVAPAVVTPGVAMVVLSGAFLAATFTNILVFPVRGVAATGLLPVAVLCIQGLILDSTPEMPIVVGVAAFYVLALLVSRARGWSLLSVACALVLVVPFAVAFGVPLTSSSTGQLSLWGQRVGSHTDLLIALSQNVEQPAATPALSFRLDRGDVAPYFGLSTITDLGGSVWSPDVATDGTPEQGTSQLPPYLDEGVRENLQNSGLLESTQGMVSVTLASIRTNWLPAPRYTFAAPDVPPGWLWSASTMSVYSAHTTNAGDSYQLSFTNLATLRDVASGSQASLILNGPGVSSDASARPDTTAATALPAETPAIVSETAKRVATGGGALEQMNQLVSFFLAGDFSYSTSAPRAEGYAGTGAQVAGTFLEKKRGYCVQFAGTLALMARTLGIPARLVVGYTPGPRAADGTYSVTSNNMHSWVEAWVPKLGWLPFDATPGVGVNASASSPSAPAPPLSSAPASSSSASSPVAPESASAPPSTPSASPLAAADAPSSSAQWLVPVLSGIAVFSALMALLLLPALLRGRARRSRLAQGRPADVWREFVATARDVGWRPPPAATSRECAQSIATTLELSHGSAECVYRAAVGFETAAFSGTRSSRGAEAISPDQAHEVIRELMAKRGAFRRLRALVAPVSLWARPLQHTRRHR